MSSRRAFHAAAPLLIFCVVGSVGLSYLLVGKVEAADSIVVKRSERAVKLEAAHRAFVGSVQLKEPSTAPIPRPE